MLQIFIRPREQYLSPNVQFFDRKITRDGAWNLLAGPENTASPLTIREATYLYNAHFDKQTKTTLPNLMGYRPWLYVMEGKLKVNGQKLTKGEAVTGDPVELERVKAYPGTTLVLLLTDLQAKMTYAGNFSGVKRFEYVAE